MNIIINQISKWALLFCVVMLSAASCTHKKAPTSYAGLLDSIKQEVLNNPEDVVASYDSMMTVIGPASDKESREIQLYLMLAKKCVDKPSTNDSLAEILVEEFSSANPLLQSLSLYIHGITHLNLGATEVALQELYKAKDVDGVTAYSRQYVRTCLAISEIYFDKGMYNLALPIKFEAVSYTKQDNDTSYLSHSYRDIANTYEVLSKVDSASVYYQKAFYYARLSGNRKAEHYLDIDYARFLLQHDSLCKAKQIIDTITVPTKRTILGAYYANKIRMFYLEQKFDSCLHYCLLQADEPDPAGRLMAYGYEYYCGLDTKNTAAALDALERYSNLNDSLFNIQKVEEIRKIRNKYDYMLAEKEKALAEKHYIHLVFGIIVITLLVVVLLFSLLQQQKLRNMRRLEVMKARLKLRHFRYEKSLESLNDKRQEVEELKNKLVDLTSKESSTEFELTNVRKELAELTVKLKSLEMTSSEMEEKAFRESPAYRRIVDAINNQEYAEVELKDWKAFQEGCQKAYPGLFAAMSEFSFNLSADEVKICYLTKLGVGTTEISRLIFKTPSAVSKVKVRTYSKLMSKDGKTADFDELIKSL